MCGLVCLYIFNLKPPSRESVGCQLAVAKDFPQDLMFLNYWLSIFIESQGLDDISWYWVLLVVVEPLEYVGSCIADFSGHYCGYDD